MTNTEAILRELIEDWRESARKLRTGGSRAGGHAVEACADELEEVLDDDE